MLPSNYYLDQINATGKLSDPEQLKIMQHFDALYRELSRKLTFRMKIKNHFKPQLIKGIYLWGEVGRGKTFLIDCLFYCLPPELKARLHFHQFMHRVQIELKAMQGHANPLKLIATKFRKEFRVLFLDEFIVSDIVDAMILAELLESLFKEGITLVTTSNTEPNQLYKNGLQRESFIPAIRLLEKNTEVLALQSPHDYRLRHLSAAGVYYTPLNQETLEQMTRTFKAITHSEAILQDSLQLLGRSIPVHQRAANVVWFEFHALCGLQRSQNDYLAITEEFSIVFISDIPIIKAEQRDLVTNFIKLVDVLYDARIKLVVSAEADPIDLYPNGPQIAEYQRTASRLIEMQSKLYFGQDNHNE